MLKKIYILKNIVLVIIIFLSTITATSAYTSQEINDLKTAGIIIATQPPGNLQPALNDGTTDTTTRLQDLINYAYNNNLVLVLPAGEYLVSNTINMIQSHPLSNRNEYAHVMIGSTRSTRPIIKLKQGSSGFNNENVPKPVVLIKAICHETEIASKCTNSHRDPNNDDANAFRNGIRNIEIKVESGNVGAVGLSFPGAQDSFVEDIKLNMGDGFAGMTDIPGLASTTGNIEIVNGDYGIYGTNARINGPTLTNIKFINQRNYAIFGVSSEKAFNIAGFEIIKNSAPAIKNGNRTYMTLMDGKIEFAQSNSQPAVDNSTQQSTALLNVYIKNSQTAVKSGNTNTQFSSFNNTSWYRIAEYYGFGSGGSKSMIVNNTEVGNNGPIALGLSTVSSIPSDLLVRHSWGTTDRSPDDLFFASRVSNSGVCNAKSLNTVKGDGDNDDKAGLQLLINSSNCKTIYLPKGFYYIGSTLTLGANTELIGTAMNISQIHSTDAAAANSNIVTSSATARSWTPTFSPPNTTSTYIVAAIITTVNDANAKTRLSNVMIRFPADPANNDWFTAIHWKAGKQSIIKTINVKPFFSTVIGSKPKADVAYTDNGGGKWFGAHGHGVAESTTTAVAGRRRFFINGTSQPLFLYNYNIEDGQAFYASEENGWQSEILNSENVVIMGSKYEDRQGVRFKNSKNSLLLGGAGRAEAGVFFDTAPGNNNGIIITSFATKRNFGTTLVWQKIGNTSLKVSMGNALVQGVYKIGTVDFTRLVIDSTDNPIPTTTPVPTSTPVPSATPTMSITPTPPVTPIPTGTPVVGATPIPSPTQSDNGDNHNSHNPSPTITKCEDDELTPFGDITCDNKFLIFIRKMKTRGITTGYSDNTFRVDIPINRAEASSLLARAFQINTSIDINSNPFTDDITGVHKQNLLMLHNLSVINGYSDGSFRSSANITRGEFTKILFKTIQIKKNNILEAENTFPDIHSASPFKGYIGFLTTNGLVNGYSDGTFKSDEYITRGQITKMIINGLEYVENNSNPEPTPTVSGTVSPTPTNTPIPTATVTPATGGDTNILSTTWKDSTNGSATLNANNYSFTYTINTKGSGTQVYQNEINITSGKNYKVEFTGKANKARSINLYIQMHTTPNTNLGLSQSVALNTSDQNFSYQFTANSSNSNARLRFAFGSSNDGDIYTIQNIKLIPLN